ncbi:MAG TPA: hypothetical protein VGB75_14920 [Jatrophihabitans sp.]|jgi:hypothetical protein|uniref:hypothetical protein n=1 Tax=Jatrophihabitans sp. TaxID=1932789 RepID=UPI002EE8080A
MTHLPTWTYQGTVPFTGDLSILESTLHSGRVAAAELGYTAEPQTIDTEEAMLGHPDGDPDTDLLTAEQAVAAGVEFSPTVLRYQMTWAAEGEPDSDGTPDGSRDSLSDSVG